jgi:hypothetical protein
LDVLIFYTQYANYHLAHTVTSDAQA